MTVDFVFICSFYDVFLLFNLVTNPQNSRAVEMASLCQCFCWNIFMSFYYVIFFLNKGWHYSCLNSSNTVLQVLPCSAVAEWLRPSLNFSMVLHLSMTVKHCLFPITVHSNGMGPDHISNSDLYGPSSSFLLSLSLSLYLSLFLPSIHCSHPLPLNLHLSLFLWHLSQSIQTQEIFWMFSITHEKKKTNTEHRFCIHKRYIFLQQLDCMSICKNVFCIIRL